MHGCVHPARWFQLSVDGLKAAINGWHALCYDYLINQHLGEPVNYGRVIDIKHAKLFLHAAFRNLRFSLKPVGVPKRKRFVGNLHQRPIQLRCECNALQILLSVDFDAISCPYWGNTSCRSAGSSLKSLRSLIGPFLKKKKAYFKPPQNYFLHSLLKSNSFINYFNKLCMGNTAFTLTSTGTLLFCK